MCVANDRLDMISRLHWFCSCHPERGNQKTKVRPRPLYIDQIIFSQYPLVFRRMPNVHDGESPTRFEQTHDFTQRLLAASRIVNVVQRPACDNGIECAVLE